MDMVKDSYKEARDRLWELFLETVRRKWGIDAATQQQVANILNVSRATLNRYLKEQRGAEVPLDVIVTYLGRLGVPMKEALDRVGPQGMSHLFGFMAEHKVELKKLAWLLENAPESEVDGILNYINLVAQKIGYPED